MLMKILKFYSSTCGPCRALENNLSKAHISHESINVEENEVAVSEYEITAVPTVIVLKEGKEVDRFHGVKTVDDLTNWYNNLK